MTSFLLAFWTKFFKEAQQQAMDLKSTKDTNTHRRFVYRYLNLENVYKLQLKLFGDGN